MKKLLFLTVFLMTAILSISQGTTLEEYNYLTKGYKIQLESGLDMKRGYRIKDVGEDFEIMYNTRFEGKKYIKGFTRKTTFKALYRDSERTPCAILMICTRTDTKYLQYLCIPRYDSDSNVWDLAFSDYKKFSERYSNAARDYTFGMFKMISYMFTNGLD